MGSAAWNRWAFQHVRELIPTVEVWRGEGPVRSLPRKERELDGVMVPGLSGAPVPLTQFLHDTYTDGFLVVKDGAIAHERYFTGMTPRTLHLSQSVAKSFAGALAGILVGRGLLDVAEPVTTYLPELAATGWKGASLQQVLDMTSGADFSEAYEDPTSDIGQLDVAAGWKPVPPGSDPDFKWPSHTFDLILRLKNASRLHGTKFTYRSIETDVLAFCMERVTGKRLPQLLSEEIWQKMGAEESGCYTVDPAGYALGDGGLNATLRDYARFGLLVLEDGGGVIPPEWIAASRQPNGAEMAEVYADSLPDGFYRNQFWGEDRVSRNLMCRGVFGQLIYVDFQHRMVVVKLSSWPDFLNTRFEMATRAAIHTMAETLG